MAARKNGWPALEKVTKISHANHSYETTRDKIDSEILGEILYKTKNFKVLSFLFLIISEENNF